MLLLVMNPEFDDGPRRVLHIVRDAFTQPEYGFIDMLAICEDFADGGPRHEPALRAAMPLTRLHVVRIEEERVPGVRACIVRHVIGQHEGLEEPTRVGQVPLGGTHVRHAADHVILDLQWRT